MVNEIKTHAWYLVVIAIGILAFHSWLSEHDARLQAEQTVKVNAQQVADLQNQIAAVTAAAAQKVTIIQQKAAAVKTPAQAIAAIPDVSSLPLHAVPVPTAPTAVQVDALALYQDLAQCQVTQVKLQACTDASALKDQELATDKQTIAALKKPKGFWPRFWGTAKAVGIGIGIGVTLAHL